MTRFDSEIADGSSANAPLHATAVVKIGSTSVTGPDGCVDDHLIHRLGAEIAQLRRRGCHTVIVSSGAIAAGWPAIRGGPRPGDLGLLQAVSAVGQPRLMQTWSSALAEHNLLAGQVLLAPLDFVHRQQYLKARDTLHHLRTLDVIPVVNENDAVADEEIRFGDNDRLAALVAHLVQADVLVLLTDAPGLLTADPRHAEDASLIEEVVEIDHELEAVAGGPSAIGSGGMASKLAAARIAVWSGVRTVIAEASRPGVLTDALSDVPGVGTTFRARPRRLPARKLWIAFALAPRGVLRVDLGARQALEERGRSLLPAGVIAVSGQFSPGDAVEITGPDGEVFAKGLTRYGNDEATRWHGRRSHELSEDLSPEIVHRDDLVVLV